ncbi:MAG: ATP-binding protein, partial [Alphaproteobacteria bacterium]|nr:ATP-binding protein [Alphaproteobacteria bacterium]
MNICAPTAFIKNWVIAHYSDRINKIWEQRNPEITKINFVVQTGFANRRTTDSSLLKRISSTPTPQNIYGGNINSSSFGLVTGPLLVNETSRCANCQNPAFPNPNYTFESFVVGKTNEFAYVAAKKVAESKNVSFNPLFLYSSVGLGKTHLMHSIISHIKKNDPNRNVIYLTAEQFVYKFVKALRYKDTAAFKEQFRSVDVLMIDDFQFMSNKGTTQDEFFHTFNSLVGEGKQVIIAADKSPTDLEGIESRLKSRLVGGLVVDIMPTDFDLR